MILTHAAKASADLFGLVVAFSAQIGSWVLLTAMATRSRGDSCQGPLLCPCKTGWTSRSWPRPSWTLNVGGCKVLFRNKWLLLLGLLVMAANPLVSQFIGVKYKNVGLPLYHLRFVIGAVEDPSHAYSFCVRTPDGDE